jgi:sigma-54-interacting transcriptional regulator
MAVARAPAYLPQNDPEEPAMECDSHTAEHDHDPDRDLDPFCPDLAVAQRAPVCILISAPRHAAWDTARRIARGCGSGLSWIDCDTVDPEEMADLLREHVVTRPQDATDRILFLREVQVLSVENQRLLDELIASQRPVRYRPRLMASSSLSLYEWVRAGLFDEGLFYKLNAVHLTA